MKTRTHGLVLLALLSAVGACPRHGAAVVIQVGTGVNLTGSVPRNPCPRGDPDDACVVNGYVIGDSVDFSHTTLLSARDTFISANPGWTFVNGGALTGSLRIDEFKVVNNCPGTGGVSIIISYDPGDNGTFPRADRDHPAQWRWAQAVHANYTPGPARPHDALAGPAVYRMDSRVGDGFAPPPLYPFQTTTGRFGDQPGTHCLHNQTLYFNACAYVSTVDYDAKRLTVYEGVSWGFTFSCVHNDMPTPGPLALGGFAVLFAARRRRTRHV